MDTLIVHASECWLLLLPKLLFSIIVCIFVVKTTVIR